MLVVSKVPGPIYPSEPVLRELGEKFGADPHNVFWTYFNDDLAQKCKQEKAMGKDCTFLGK